MCERKRESETDREGERECAFRVRIHELESKTLFVKIFFAFIKYEIGVKEIKVEVRLELNELVMIDSLPAARMPPGSINQKHSSVFDLLFYHLLTSYKRRPWVTITL